MCDKWLPVTTALRVLRLLLEERPPIWRVDANILNKQSRTADKGRSSSLELQLTRGSSQAWGLGEVLRTPQPENVSCYVSFTRRALGDPGVDGRIILRWIFRKWDVGVWTGSSWLRVGTAGVHL